MKKMTAVPLVDEHYRSISDEIIVASTNRPIKKTNTLTKFHRSLLSSSPSSYVSRTLKLIIGIAFSRYSGPPVSSRTMCSKQLADGLLIVYLVMNTIAMAACNIKTIAEPPWAGVNGEVQNVVRHSSVSPVEVNQAPRTHQPIYSSQSSMLITSVKPAGNEYYVASPTLPAAVSALTQPSIIAGYPTAALSPHSVSRQKLLQLLNNPAFKRPNMDDLPVHVMIKLIPIKIQDLIEKNEVLETTLRLQLTWQDKRLSWNAELFHNVTEVVIPGNLIWVPDIAILNSVSDLYHVVRDTRFEMKIESNGRIWWHPTGIVKTNCKLYLRYFPFDKQMCKFVFESPTFDLRFMNLTLRSEKSPVDTRMYTDGETWQLLGFTGKNIVNQVGSKTFFARVEFLIRIERAKIYHLLNVILPAIFLSTVQVMFFLLPATHPQRVGSSTTTLLSVVVFQTVAVAQLPKTSTDIPLLSIYIFFVIIVSALSVGTSIIVAKFVVYADKNVEIPSWIAHIPHPASCWHALICCLCCCCRAYRLKMSDRQVNQAASKQFLTSQNSDRPSGSGTSVRVSLASPQSVNGGYTSQLEVEPKGDFRLKIGESPSGTPAHHPHHPSAGGYHGHAEGRRSIFAHHDTRYLFQTWQDISRFVDISLMIVAASIAVLSPVALFVIMPAIAPDRHLIDVQHTVS